MRFPRTLATLAAICLLPATLSADVIRQEDNGFTVQNSITVSKDLMFIHRTLTAHINQWWPQSHTWSNDAGNLKTEMEEGGGMYETLPNGGFVEHLRLVFYSPGGEYRWEGALGPLQSMPVTGRFIWSLAAVEESYSITFTYHVWGDDSPDYAALAPAVDGMMKETISSLETRLNRQ